MKESVRLPAKLSELRLIGKLIEERTVHVEAWEGYKAIEKLLRFNGLSLQVITFTNDAERYNLSAVTIESPRWSVSPIPVGSPVSDLQARVAGFVPKSTGAWHLAGESDSLHIEARNGKVTRVAYECYTG